MGVLLIHDYYNAMKNMKKWKNNHSYLKFIYIYKISDKKVQLEAIPNINST